MLQRYEIVNGVVEVECVNEAPMDEDKETENGKLSTISVSSMQIDLNICFKISCQHLVPEKGVPNFWLTAMKTNEILAEEVNNNECYIYFVV